MHLIIEIVWKIVAFIVVGLFCISLPFILLALLIWHPHLTAQQQDAMCFLKLWGIVFGGVAAAFWWIVMRTIIFVVTKERVWIGAWSTVLVFFGTYYVEYLVMAHGVIR
jgi:hypothetical protein